MRQDWAPQQCHSTDFTGKATNQASESESVNTSAFLATYLVSIPTSGLMTRDNFLLARNPGRTHEFPFAREFFNERPAMRKVV
jgi:hypothetical protein